eukprot:359426-Chlamydomonas_euryale.AAC.9
MGAKKASVVWGWGAGSDRPGRWVARSLRERASNADNDVSDTAHFVACVCIRPSAMQNAPCHAERPMPCIRPSAMQNAPCHAEGHTSPRQTQAPAPQQRLLRSGRVGQPGKVWTSTTRGPIAQVAPPPRFGGLANAALPRLAAATEIARPPEAIFSANAERVILCGLHQRGSKAQWNHPPATHRLACVDPHLAGVAAEERLAHAMHRAQQDAALAVNVRLVL